MNRFYRPYSTLPILPPRRAWAEIDLYALRENYRTLCAAVGCANRKIRPIAVVKADAYGHGAPACVRALMKEGCNFFAVSCIEEAMEVRRACGEENVDVLILGYTDPTLAGALADGNIIQALISERYAEALQREASRAGVRVRAHIALDTGMNRIGFSAQNKAEIEETVRAIFRVRLCENLQIEGMFTHFARADEEAGVADTDLQADRFRTVRSRLTEGGTRISFCHVCNSAGSLGRLEDCMDGVRFGIALYGVCPIEKPTVLLRPVMRLCTTVTHVHRVSDGAAVGYGGTWIAKGDRWIATLPIGYADGWLRAYRGATVTVSTESGERAAPIVGRICMDQCMIDVTGTGAREGDTVTLFGGGDSQALSVLATRAGTIEYETLCLISSRVPRVYVKKPKGA